MLHPQCKNRQVNIAGKPLVWNDLPEDEYVVVYREVRGTEYCFFGQVKKMERLRNCVMMHLDIWEVWYTGALGHELPTHDVRKTCDPDPNRGRYGVMPYPVRWKKKKHSEVLSWDPKEMPGQHPNPSRSNDMPSNRTATEFNRPFEWDRAEFEYQEKLKARAEQRRAHAAARNLMNQHRDALGQSLLLVGLTYESTKDDFKQATRVVMLKWHPDKEIPFIQAGGSKEEFKAQSLRFTNALAHVKHALMS